MATAEAIALVAIREISGCRYVYAEMVRGAVLMVAGRCGIATRGTRGFVPFAPGRDYSPEVEVVLQEAESRVRDALPRLGFTSR